jgi:hypothetical protein
MGTVSIWVNPPRETPVDRAIRERAHANASRVLTTATVDILIY